MEYKESHIALFPLNIFLLPGDYTQLYIFEDRYKQLINDCIKDKMAFGIAFSNAINVQNLGSLVEVSEVIERHPGGEMDIMVKAISVFQLEKFYIQKEGKLYPEGKVRELEAVRNVKVGNQFLSRFREYLLKYKMYSSDVLAGMEPRIFDVANEMYLGDQEKVELIGLADPEKMENYLRNYIRYLELLQVQEKNVFQNIYLN